MSSEDVKIETSFSDAQDRPIFDHSKLTGFLKQYSFDDLAKAFLAVHLWLPNIASTVKLQYAYVTLESICRELSSENKIRTYENFRRFCEEFFRLLPSFETLEDFVPETDWGEIEYFFHDQRYRIFYGSELCNAYDFYYGFEIVSLNLISSGATASRSRLTGHRVFNFAQLSEQHRLNTPNHASYFAVPFGGLFAPGTTPGRCRARPPNSMQPMPTGNG